MLVLPEKNGSDEESGNYKKDVNADESTWQPLPLQVKDENRKYGYRSKSIDSGTVYERRITCSTGEAQISTDRVLEGH